MFATAITAYIILFSVLLAIDYVLFYVLFNNWLNNVFEKYVVIGAIVIVTFLIISLTIFIVQIGIEPAKLTYKLLPYTIKVVTK